VLQFYLAFEMLTVTPLDRAKIECIITGDKDFLESGLTQPKMMTASEFLKAQK
jgi:hypothetical protein